MITVRRMKQAIYQTFAQGLDAPADIRPEDWPDPWRSIWLLAERAPAEKVELWDGVLRYATMYAANANEEYAQRLLYEIEAGSKPVHYPSLAEIASSLPPVAWLWPRWLPRGMMSLLGAYQGTGKSYFVLALAQAIIAGQAWPDGAANETRGTVVYVEAESIPQVTSERATALGIDTRRLYLVMAEEGQVLDLTQPRWQDHLLDLVDTVRPELVIVDSYTSISTLGQNSVEETNGLLMFLAGLARHGNCGMLALHHLRKPGGGQMSLPGMSIHDFRGSGHITAMARTVMGLSVVQTGRQFSLKGPRRLDLVKSNLGDYPDGIGLNLVKEDDGRVRFEYGKPVGFEDAQPPSCDEWLVEYLAEHGPSKPKEVVAAAEKLGFSRAMVFRVRTQLRGQVMDSHGPRVSCNRWVLTGGDGDGQVEQESDDDAV